MYVAGETKERLQRLGFGVADAEQSADGEWQKMQMKCDIGHWHCVSW